MTCLGVSHLAGLKVGLWHRKEEFVPRLKIEKEFVPQGNAEKHLQAFEKWERVIGVFKEMNPWENTFPSDDSSWMNLCPARNRCGPGVRKEVTDRSIQEESKRT